MNPNTGVDLLDAHTNLKFEDGNAVFKRTQEISDHFLSNLASKRLSTANQRMGEMHHVASIPTAIVEKWMAEGFNIYDKNVDLKEILKRLNSQDMQGLLATSKSVI